MAQLYVGKRPVSKGIGRVIRRFVVLSFAPAALIGAATLECCKEAPPYWWASSNFGPGTASDSRRRDCNRIGDFPAKCSNLVAQETRDALRMMRKPAREFCSANLRISDRRAYRRVAS